MIKWRKDQNKRRYTLQYPYMQGTGLEERIYGKRNKSFRKSQLEDARQQETRKESTRSKHSIWIGASVFCFWGGYRPNLRDSVIVLCFVVRYFVPILALQSWVRESWIALLCLSSSCFLIVVWLFLTPAPWIRLQFVIVVFHDHTHILFLQTFNKWLG